jgi:hypothetical protein
MKTTRFILSFLVTLLFSALLFNVGASIAPEIDTVANVMGALPLAAFALKLPAGSLAIVPGAPARMKATNRQRAIYNDLRYNTYAGQRDVIITDSYLRFETTLGTSTSLSFNTLVNQGAQTVTEHRLNMPDRFCVTDMAFFIRKVAAATPTDGQIASAQLDTFPNPLTYTGAGEAAALNALYNSYLTVRIDSVVYYDSLDLLRFYRVPTSQQNVSYVVASPAGNTIQADGWDTMNYGFAPIDPTFSLDGKAKNDISVTLPTSIAMAGTSSVNYAVLIVRGFLLQNASGRPVRG